MHYLALMKKDRSRLLILLRDMDAYDLPEELSIYSRIWGRLALYKTSSVASKGVGYGDS